MPIELNFYGFDVFGGVMKLPSQILLYRSARPEVKGITTVPVFVSMKAIADFYKHNEPYRIEEAYITTRELRLLDIRFFQQLIPYILTHHGSSLNQATLDFFKKICIAFGGCSLSKQIELLKEWIEEQEHIHRDIPTQLYKRLEKLIQFQNTADPIKISHLNPIEIQGFRIAITNLDHEVIKILKMFFSEIDGFISPNLFTPFHDQGGDNNLLPEIILFTPNDVMKPYITNEKDNIYFETLQNMIHHYTFTDLFKPQLNMQYKMKGGRMKHWDPLVADREPVSSPSIKNIFTQAFINKLPRFIQVLCRPYKIGDEDCMNNYNAQMLRNYTKLHLIP